MSIGLTIKIEGLDKLIAKLRGNDMLGPALREGFEKVGYVVTSEAKKRAPVDRGTLRASIAHEVDPSPVPQWVRIGAKPFYAPYMEFGTGLVHDHPSWPRKRHVVPVAALAGWAGRVGADAGGAANAISRRGGLKPRRYLRGALEDNGERIVRLIAGSLRKAGRAAGG